MRILILGGTTEASAIARALAGDTRFSPVLSLAGRTRAPVPPPIPWRVGGFGGAAGLAEYLRCERMDALIDATHPFASQIKANAAAQKAIPRIAVLRPPWLQQRDDRWIPVPDMTAAARTLGATTRRVFLTVGRGDLTAFGPPHSYLVRLVDAPTSAPEGAVILAARGPFTEEEERALMTTYCITTLVTKNSGGTAVAGKLAAARSLGITVVMVARPPPPEGLVVPDVAGALAWLHAQAALRGV